MLQHSQSRPWISNHYRCRRRSGESKRAPRYGRPDAEKTVRHSEISVLSKWRFILSLLHQQTDSASSKLLSNMGTFPLCFLDTRNSVNKHFVSGQQSRPCTGIFLWRKRCQSLVHSSLSLLHPFGHDSRVDISTNAERERDHSICSAKEVPGSLWFHITIIPWTRTAEL